MTAGILFFNVGTKCLARLAVAIHSLRKHYAGPATVLNVPSDENRGILQSIASDARLAIDVKEIPFNQLRRNSAYCAKAGLWRYSPYAASLLVDSDVLFLKPVYPLLQAIRDETLPGFLVTAFSDWMTNKKIIGGRIERWRGVKCDGFDVAGTVAESLAAGFPAINTGLVSWRNDAATRPTLEAWERLTLAGCRNPFTDELAAQLLVRRYPHQLMPETWNSSVLYAVDRENAAVIHYHGKKNLRPEDGGRWIAAYLECCQQRIANIQDWAVSTDPALQNL